MALTAQAQAIWDAWIAVRPGFGETPATAGTLYSALVSDLADGDYIVGLRAKKVPGTDSTVSSVRTFTVQRAGTTFTVAYPTGATVWITR